MDVFRKAFLAGLGAFSLSRDKVTEFVNELVKEGELHEEDGQKIVDELMAKVKVAKDDLGKNIRAQVDSASQKVSAASISQLKKLQQRLAELEQRLAKAAGAAKAKGAKPKGTRAKGAKPKGTRAKGAKPKGAGRSSRKR